MAIPQELLSTIFDGNSILFVGAGFSQSSTNVRNEIPKLGNQLADHLYEQCEIKESDHDLENSSQLFLEKHGAQRLVDLLRYEYTIKDVSPNQIALASVPWKRTYTTNYDNSLELAYSRSGKLLTPAVVTDNIKFSPDLGTVCVHINGFIDRVGANSIQRDIRLTQAAYQTTDFLRTKWVDLLRLDLQSCSSVVFIGFSLERDLDLSRILSESSSTRNKTFFITSDSASELKQMKLNRFGTVLPVGMNSFAQAVSKHRGSVRPEREPRLFSFVPVRTSDAPKEIRDKDFQNLLLLGKADTGMIQYSTVDPAKYPYYVNRAGIQNVISHVKNGQRNFLIHSDLGNGKTLFLSGLLLQLQQNGYRVFRFGKYYDKTFEELEVLCKFSQPIAIAVENYSNHLELIEKIEMFRDERLVLILSERSIVNDTVYYHLDDILSASYFTLDLNRLAGNEVTQVVGLFNHYGLWGDHATLSTERKVKHCADTLKGNLRLILLDVLRSPDIQKRFTRIVEDLKRDEVQYSAILLMLSFAIFDISIDLDDLVYILDDEYLNNPSFYNNPKLKELINFSSGDLNVKSSILAEAILGDTDLHEDLVDLLISVVSRVDRSRYDRNFYNLLKNVINYSKLQRLLRARENPQGNELIVRFFDAVKTLGYSKENPFFWLQNAIARLAIRDYKMADVYFKNAYTFAKKKRDFDTFQIDNHFARHILEQELFNGSNETAMQQFVKAHQILMSRSDTNQNRHYPFKVARAYYRFYERFFPALDPQDKRIFLVSCKELLNRIGEYNNAVEEERRHPVVASCQTEMHTILNANKNLVKDL